MAKEDFEKVTVRLATGTRDRLIRFFPATPYNEVVRKIISTTLDRLEARETTPKLELPNE